MQRTIIHVNSPENNQSETEFESPAFSSEPTPTLSPPFSPALPPSSGSSTSRGSFSSLSSTPPFRLDTDPAPLLNASSARRSSFTRNFSEEQLPSWLSQLEDDIEPEEKDTSWIKGPYMSVHKDIFDTMGIVVFREPQSQRPDPAPRNPVTENTLLYGSATFAYGERADIEKNHKESVKAFTKNDWLMQKISSLANAYQPIEATMTAPTRPATIEEALNPFFKREDSTLSKRQQKKHPNNKASATSTSSILAFIAEVEHKTENTTAAQHSKPQQKPNKKKGAAPTPSPSIMDIIQGYAAETNTTAVYRLPTASSYDPIPFQPLIMRVNDLSPTEPNYAAIKIYPWTSGGNVNELKSSELQGFSKFVIASCMFGTSITGRDSMGGSFPIIKHDIKLFEDQIITSIRCAESSFYEEAQFEEFKISAHMMLRLGNINKCAIQPRSSNPADSSIIKNDLYLYQENDAIFYATKTEKGIVRAKIEESELNNFYAPLLALLKTPRPTREMLDLTTKAELLKIATQRKHLPRIQVISHIPSIDYMLFAIRLYLEGKMTLKALEAFCIAVLRKKEGLSKRLNKVFPSELGFEVVVICPYDNLFNISEIGPKKNISKFIMQKLGIKNIDTPDYQDTPESDAKETQAAIVERCIELLKTNTFHPDQASIWSDFIAIAKENGDIENLEELFKIGNAVIVGVASYGMKPYEVCSIQPYPEMQIQNAFNSYAQKSKRGYPPVFHLTHFGGVIAYHASDVQGAEKRPGVPFYYDDFEKGAENFLKQGFFSVGARNGACSPGDSFHKPVTSKDIHCSNKRR